jgi:3'-phosphoadenosine 5'-phosphosulfate (PAPS) 3'-phosphatase
VVIKQLINIFESGELVEDSVSSILEHTADDDLAYDACGRFDAFYEYNLSPWDVAGGAFIVQQTSGKVSDFEGKDNFLFGKEIIAASPLVFEELVGKLREWKGAYI